MTLCGIFKSERIIVHPDNAPHESHWINITIDKDNPVFYVTSCCDEDWSWDFWYSKTNYDVVKYIIMDCIAECKTMDQLIYVLDDCFEEECADMICYEAELQEDEFECECDGDCDNCEFNED